MSKRWITLLGIGTALFVALVVLGSTTPVEAKGGKGKGGLSLIKLYNQALVNATAQVTGLTDKQVQDGLKSGQSLEDIVKTAGTGTIYDVENAAKQSLTASINQLVTDGKLTSKHAATLIGNLDKRLSKAVRQHHRARHKSTKGKGKTKGKGSKTTKAKKTF